MSDYQIMEHFRIQDRQCYVIQIRGRFCNGYIELKHKLNQGYDDFNHNAHLTEEATFFGVLPVDNRTYLGFDTMHWNDTPATQTPLAVRTRLIEWAPNVIKYDESEVA